MSRMYSEKEKQKSPENLETNICTLGMWLSFSIYNLLFHAELTGSERTPHARAMILGSISTLCITVELIVTGLMMAEMKAVAVYTVPLFHSLSFFEES